MRRITLVRVLFSTVLLAHIAAQIHQTNTTSNGVTVTARYFDKRVYYPNTPILVKITIRNDSSNDFVLQLADEPILNLDVHVKTLTNRSVPPSETYFTRLTSIQPFVYRLMNLRPGEEYSFDFDLLQFVHIDEPGSYIVDIHFIPCQLSTTSRLRYTELSASTISVVGQNSHENALSKDTPFAASSLPAVLSANTLALTIRPSGDNHAILDELIAEDTGEILKRQMFAPDEVIRYTLQARQQDQWNKFFVYFDLESLFLINTDRNHRYRSADTKTKEYMLKNFRQDLINGQLELDVVTRPFTYEIVSVYYTEKDARVVTKQVYRQPQYDEVKQYTWYLHRDDSPWVIYNYEVKNLGTK